MSTEIPPVSVPAGIAAPGAYSPPYDDEPEFLLPFAPQSAAGPFSIRDRFAGGDRRAQCAKLERLIERSIGFVEVAPRVAGAAYSLAGLTAVAGVAGNRIDAVRDPIFLYGAAGAMLLAGRAVDLYSKVAQQDAGAYMHWFFAMSCREILHPSPFDESAMDDGSSERSRVQGAFFAPAPQAARQTADALMHAIVAGAALFASIFLAPGAALAGFAVVPWRGVAKGSAEGERL